MEIPPIVRFIPGIIEVIEGKYIPNEVSALTHRSQSFVWVKIEAPDIPSLVEYQAIAEEFEAKSEISLTTYLENMARIAAHDNGFTDSRKLIISVYFQKGGELIIFDGRSFPSVTRDFNTSTLVAKLPPNKTIAKLSLSLRSRFKKITIKNPSPTLLVVQIKDQRLFKKPWVKIDLAIIISGSQGGSTITILAIAWGENGINPPKTWDEQINPFEVTGWVSSYLIPLIKQKL